MWIVRGTLILEIWNPAKMYILELVKCGQSSILGPCWKNLGRSLCTIRKYDSVSPLLFFLWHTQHINIYLPDLRLCSSWITGPFTCALQKDLTPHPPSSSEALKTHVPLCKAISWVLHFPHLPRTISSYSQNVLAQIANYIKDPFKKRHCHTGQKFKEKKHPNTTFFSSSPGEILQVVYMINSLCLINNGCHLLEPNCMRDVSTYMYFLKRTTQYLDITNVNISLRWYYSQDSANKKALISIARNFFKFSC